tara:strand:+ start:504 stop:710 length:207 start_codon:yes stop_codon:yes gene_type:complete
MTPKEKAQELVDKFRNEILSFLGDRTKDQNAKRCALVAVDEILNINSVDKDFSLSHYWLDVKDEIQNL